MPRPTRAPPLNPSVDVHACSYPVLWTLHSRWGLLKRKRRMPELPTKHVPVPARPFIHGPTKPVAPDDDGVIHGPSWPSEKLICRAVWLRKRREEAALVSFTGHC
jgi:hypothetical protein